jgi:hypothetical protein
MTLPIPAYIDRAGVVGAPIEHAWSDADADDALVQQPELAARLGAISYRANFAVSLGAAEWLTWRLSGELADRDAFEILEAMWLAMIDWRYYNFAEFPDWLGELPRPVGGPMDVGFNLLSEVLANAREVQPVSDLVAQLADLPVRVLPRPEPYRSWRRDVIRRLTTLYRIGSGDPLGPPVPREALDSEAKFDPASAETLLRGALRTADPRVNRYLSSPEQMANEGFVGSPYPV